MVTQRRTDAPWTIRRQAVEPQFEYEIISELSEIFIFFSISEYKYSMGVLNF
jgi:hypothetical protein